MILAGQGVQSAANFLSGVMVARFGSTAELGLYALGVTALFLVSMLTDTLLTTPLTDTAVRRRSPTSRIRALRAALLGGVLLAGGGGLLCAGLGLASPGFARLLPALPAALLTVTLREVLRRSHYAEQEAGLALLSDAGAFVIQFAILGQLALWHRLDAPSAFAAMAAGSGTMVAFGLLRSARHIGRGGLAVPYLRRYLRYGAWLAAGSLCQVATGQALSWFLFLASDAVATGTYAACLTVTNMLNPLLIGLTNYARPRLMRLHAAQGWDALVRGTLRLVPVFVAPVGILVVAAVTAGETMMQLAYGSGLRGAGPVLAFTASALAATALAAPVQLAMLAIRRPRAILAMHAAAAGATALIGAPLVWRHGLEGAAMACCLSAVAGLAAIGILFTREVLRRRQGAGPRVSLIPRHPPAQPPGGERGRAVPQPWP